MPPWRQTEGLSETAFTISPSRLRRATLLYTKRAFGAPRSKFCEGASRPEQKISGTAKGRAAERVLRLPCVRGGGCRLGGRRRGCQKPRSQSSRLRRRCRRSVFPSKGKASRDVKHPPWIRKTRKGIWSAGLRRVFFADKGKHHAPAAGNIKIYKKCTNKTPLFYPFYSKNPLGKKKFPFTIDKRLTSYYNTSVSVAYYTLFAPFYKEKGM